MCIGPAIPLNQLYLCAYPSLEPGTVCSYTSRPLPDVVSEAMGSASNGGLLDTPHETTGMAHYKVEIEVPEDWKEGHVSRPQRDLSDQRRRGQLPDFDTPPLPHSTRQTTQHQH